MRKLLIALLILSPLAWAAVNTTTISGKILLPSGAAAPGGTITCELSQAGSVEADGTTQRVATRTSAAITTAGTVSIALVPNDQITPSGTYYTCRINTTGFNAASWSEKWSVEATPDPEDLGDVTRLDVPPGVTVGSFMEYQSTEPSGACTASETPVIALNTLKTCQCTALVWVCSGPETTVDGSSGEVPFLATDGTLTRDADLTYNATSNTLTCPNLTGNASTSSALAANPTDCSANQFANAIAASGNLTCSAIADADVPNGITVDLATASTTARGIKAADSAGVPNDVNGDGTTDYTITAGDLDGNGTANTADWDINGTLDEPGGIVSNALKINRLFLPTGTGSTGITHGGNILQLIAMMSTKCIDPWTCSRPAIVDTWQALFHGQPMRFNADAGGGYYEIAQGNINKCYGADCTGNENYMCIDSVADLDADGTRDIDPDADGTAEFKLGDTFTVGNNYAPTLRSHLIYSMADGDGTTCPATTVRIVVAPYVAETAEGVAAGVKIMNTWRNRLHANFNAGYLLGYRLLGYGSAMTGWQMGPNLLANGDLDYDATPGRWTVSGTAPDGRSWYNNPITTGFGSLMCSQGSTTNVCMDMGGTTAADYWETEDWIAVTPGERLVGSCFIRDPGTAPNSTIFGIYSDANEDGTLSAETGMTWTVPAVNAFEFTSTLQQWYASWTIPEGVSRIKFRITKTTTAPARPLLDDCWLRRPSTSVVESYDTSTKTEYLVPDPGNRTILITGDSWAVGFTDACEFPCNTTLGYYIRDGLADALQARLGRDVSGQIYLTGIAGINSSQVLSGTTCREDADEDGTNRDWGYTGGSESCFYMQIERYAPAIVIVSLGTNDAQQSVAAATFLNQMRQLGAKIRAIGAFPIFLTPSPISKDEDSDNTIDAADFGSGKSYEFAHSYRDALKNAWRMGQL